jgi:endonuclease-3
MTKRPKLSARLDALEALYGPPAAVPSRDPLELILWENVGYLVTDEKRAECFKVLKKRVGTSAKALCAARIDVLQEIALLGGMHPEARAEKLREIGELALELGGDLRAVLAWPLPKARRAFQKFPGIGAPGAEKILLFTRTEPVFALESNGLRVLLRLGYGEESKNYSTSYKSVQQAVAGELERDCDVLIRAHQLLRKHGQELCLRTAPDCDSCPISRGCAWAEAHG